jgi:hypothetical protein
MSQQATAGSQSWRSQAIEASVHRACTNCGAPGVWSSETRIKLGWPGCYVPPTDERMMADDKSVGKICPNCRATRKASLTENLGVIWRKIW